MFVPQYSDMEANAGGATKVIELLDRLPTRKNEFENAVRRRSAAVFPSLNGCSMLCQFCLCVAFLVIGCLPRGELGCSHCDFENIVRCLCFDLGYYNRPTVPVCKTDCDAISIWTVCDAQAGPCIPNSELRLAIHRVDLKLHLDDLAAEIINRDASGYCRSPAT